MSQEIKREELKLFVENWGGSGDDPDCEGIPKLVLETSSGMKIAEGINVHELLYELNNCLQWDCGYMTGTIWNDEEECQNE